MIPIKAGTTDVSAILRFLDATDGTPELGVSAATAGLVIEYRRELGADTAITPSNASAVDAAHSDGAFIHIGDGYYRIDLPDAACASSSGIRGVLVHAVATSMVGVGSYLVLTGYDPYDTVRAGLTALPNAAADAAGGLPISDAGGLDMDAIGTNAAGATSNALVASSNALVANATAGVASSNALVASSNALLANATAGAASSNALVASSNALLANTTAGAASSNALVANSNALLVLADTNDIQTRLPAALVSGRIDASVGAVAANAITAAAIADGAIDRATLAADTGLQSIRSGTAQAGGSTSIAVDSGASAVNDFYNNTYIYLTGGTGVGQARFISEYDGSTKIATVNSVWATNPSSDSTFAIIAFSTLPGASAPTAAEVADAVWDEAQADHTSAGTFGIIASEIADILVDTGTTLDTAIAGASSNALVASSNALLANTNALAAGSNALVASSNALVANATAGAGSSNALVANSNAILAATNAGVASSNAVLANAAAGVASSNAVLANTNALAAGSNALVASSNALVANATAGVASSNALVANSNIIVVDTVVDAILVDTGTTLDAAIAVTNSNALLAAANALVASSNALVANSNVIVVDTVVDAILVDTGTTLQAELDGIQADTEDIQTRLPAALVSGRMDSTVSAINNVTTAAARIARSTQGIVLGTVGSASTTSNIVTSSLDPAAAASDQLKGRIVTFEQGTTTVNLRGQSTDITASTPTGELTATPLTTAPVSGDVFVIT